MKWQTHKKLLLKNPKFRKAFEETQPEFQVVKAMIEAGLEQKKARKDKD